MENVFCPVKTAELSYRLYIDNTFVVMVDNTGTKLKFQRLVTLTIYMWLKRVAVRTFAYPGPTYFWLHRTKGLCNHASNVTDRFQMDVIL